MRMKKEKGRRGAGNGFIYSARRLAAPLNGFGGTGVRGASTVFCLAGCFF